MQQKHDKVYELDLHGKKIACIENLEKFRHLRALDLSCNAVQRIEGLSSLRDLRELKLYGNEIEVIGGLERLTELCNLLLQHNKIRCIGPSLSSQRKLQLLRLDHNHLVKVSPCELQSCTCLTHLDLSHNHLATVEGLGHLAALEELRLASNMLTTLPDVTRCRKLQELDISLNPVDITSLTKLKTLQQLKILRVEGLHITHITSLPTLRCLEELHTCGNELQSIKGLSVQFPALEYLDVRGNQLLGVEGDLHCLTELMLEGNPLCAPLENYRSEMRALLPNLEVLDGVSLSVAMATTRGPAPLMRPLTPSSVGPSVGQIVEHQLAQAEIELENYESGLRARFELVRATVDSVAKSVSTTSPAERSATCLRDRPSSHCSSRVRLQEALSFASEHFNIADT